jgi:Holliday junction resolvasome RuvABC endonuclease subunit
MIVMGIDASTSSTGWSIFEDDKLITYGVIKSKGEDWRERLIRQGPKLTEIIKKYNPEKIIIEDVPLKSSNSKILVILGAVQGFIYGIISAFEIPVQFVLPNEWRSPLCLYDGTREGTKRKELKKKSIEKANQLFGLNLNWVSPSSSKNDDDVSDAILIVYSQTKKRWIGK